MASRLNEPRIDFTQEIEKAYQEIIENIEEQEIKEEKLNLQTKNLLNQPMYQ